MHNSFYEIFAGLDRAHGQFRIGEPSEEGKKVKGRASTVLTPPTPELWQKHLAGNLGLGIIPIRDDASCVWGAIDIDEYDLDLVKLEKVNAKHDIPAIICRTKSGGAHLYFFMKKPIAASKIRAKLEEIAATLGFPGVEVFPKQVKLANDKDVGNWINMPYFDSAHGRTMRYAIGKDGKALSATEFLALVKERSLDPKQLIELKIKNVGILSDGPPCLQHLCKVGFPGGSMNHALFSMGAYAKKKFPDEWEQWVDTYNHEYMGPGSSQEVLNIIKSLKKKNYAYKCKDQPLAKHCNKQLCARRKFGIGGGKDELPYVLGTLVKINSSPPTWFIDVDGHRIELTTDELIDQRKFRKMCIERIHKFPSMVKGFVWDDIIAERLETLEVQEAPRDAGTDGQFLNMIEKFISRPRAETREQLMLGRHLVDEDGCIIFRSGDLIAFLDRERFREYKQSSDVWAALRRIGATHGQYNLKGKCVTWWKIPPQNVQDEEFEIREQEDAPY